ncbi:pirin family protein [Soonwooa sp.]|uniref:pirin family protein n=1 Tax=Soonwooa sp. TaxID=1938592 RepID=UPI002606CB99|nr:pirin family protein [Soonwooa sp.]
MKTTFYKADSRGLANHGWLKSNHTFSFANYYNPERMNFGVLRVINDDFVEGGMGFGRHPHRDMEIISIPLEGRLKHGDNMGNLGFIEKGDIQVMSAGTGVMHSEENGNDTDPVKFLQIWVIPNKQDVTPRYDQQNFEDKLVPNQFLQILSPNADDEGVWIHQDAWFNWGRFTEDTVVDYKMHKEGNGLYVFVLEGGATVGEQVLERRDAIGVWETNNVDLKINKGSEILLMEVPMQLPQ